ncbi:MAG: hypothetical protein ACP5RT_02325 [Candidatus Micrarchaeia archaeon]
MIDTDQQGNAGASTTSNLNTEIPPVDNTTIGNISKNKRVGSNRPFIQSQKPLFYLANSSFVNSSEEIKLMKKSLSSYGAVLIGLLIMLVILPVLVAPFFTILFASLLIVFLIYNGYSNFSKHILIANTPISKAESAPVGFGIFNVRFNPENGKSLISPLTKTPCAFYSVSLINVVSKSSTIEGYGFDYYKNYNSYSITNFRNKNILISNSVSKGTKSTLYDGTGHLVMNYASIPGLKGQYKLIKINVTLLDSLKRIGNLPAEISPLNDTITQLKGSDDVDFTNALSKLQTISYNTRFGVPTTFQKDGWYLVEYCLPTNYDYTAAGFVNHMSVSFNNKPVSSITPDPSSKVYLLEPGNQKQITKKEMNTALFSFAGSLIIFLLIYAFGINTNLYRCLLLSNNSQSTIFYCHLLNGTVIPLSQLNSVGSAATPQASSNQTPPTSQASSSQTSPATTHPTGQQIAGQNVNCSSLQFVDNAFLNEENKTCTWGGGYLDILMGGGYSGFASVKIVASNGSTMFSKGKTYWCPQDLGSIYLPNGNYTVIFNTGRGGGSCGPAVLTFTSS